MDPLNESLAELYAVALPSGAAHRRDVVEADRAEALMWVIEEREQSDVDWSDDLRDLLDKVPERTGEVHDDNCYTRHASCLADKIRALMP